MQNLVSNESDVLVIVLGALRGEEIRDERNVADERNFLITVDTCHSRIDGCICQS
jgi:hypothetical protein